MAVNQAPIFTKSGIVGFARLTAGNASMDGSGTLTTILTGGADGYMPVKVVFTAAPLTAAASTNKKGRVYITDAAGTTTRLLGEVNIANATPSASAIGATATYTFPDGFILPAGYMIKVDISIYSGVQDQTDVIIYAGNFTQ
jgi:hypothetical protein